MDEELQGRYYSSGSKEKASKIIGPKKGSSAKILSRLLPPKSSHSKSPFEYKSSSSARKQIIESEKESQGAETSVKIEKSRNVHRAYHSLLKHRPPLFETRTRKNRPPSKQIQEKAQDLAGGYLENLSGSMLSITRPKAAATSMDKLSSSNRPFSSLHQPYSLAPSLSDLDIYNRKADLSSTSHLNSRYNSQLSLSDHKPKHKQAKNDPKNELKSKRPREMKLKGESSCLKKYFRRDCDFGGGFGGGSQFEGENEREGRWVGESPPREALKSREKVSQGVGQVIQNIQRLYQRVPRSLGEVGRGREERLKKRE